MAEMKADELTDLVSSETKFRMWAIQKLTRLEILIEERGGQVKLLWVFVTGLSLLAIGECVSRCFAR